MLQYLKTVSLKGPPNQNEDIPLRLGKVIATKEDIQKVWWSKNPMGYGGSNNEVGVMTFQRPDEWSAKKDSTVMKVTAT